MRKSISVFLVFTFIALTLPMPEAKAIDPVTLAILAPVALKVAQAATPYLSRGVYNGGRCLIKMGEDLLQFFYLPYGLGYMCYSFKGGLVYTIRGGIAPAKFMFHTLMLPLMLFGININI